MHVLALILGITCVVSGKFCSKKLVGEKWVTEGDCDSGSEILSEIVKDLKERAKQQLPPPLTSSTVETTASTPAIGGCSTCQVAQRNDCGYPSIGEARCIAKGCCYNNSISGVAWCFYPMFNLVVSTECESNTTKSLGDTEHFESSDLGIPN